jgi:hypothetical protein
LYEKYVIVAFVDQNPDGEEGEAPLLEEERWEEREIFDVIWMRSKGWGANTKLFDSSDRDEDMKTYVINAALHTMIRASRNNKRRMFTKIPSSDAEPGLVPDGPLPPTWNDQQHALLKTLGLDSDNSDDTDDEDDNADS